MQCPYCLSELAAEVLVCPHCTRELYLVRTLQQTINALELKLKDLPEIEKLQARLNTLESGGTPVASDLSIGNPAVSRLADWAIYWLAPLLLLLVSHALITVAYDFNTLVLRIVSLLLPLPFAFALMQHRRSFWLWLCAAAMMSMLAVIGMSGITSLVDHTPLMPQNARELREFIEYAASIGFSFATGMIIGNLRRMRREAAEQERIDALAARLVTVLSSGKHGAEKIYTTLTKLREIIVSLTAVATTAVATYAGLKGIMGW